MYLWDGMSPFVPPISKTNRDTSSYQDDASKIGRTLPDKKYTNKAMTIEMCASYAKALKYVYFGLEYGRFS